MRAYLYQWRALVLMMIAWSMIGVVNNSVGILFPAFSQTFALDDGHNGYLTGVFSLFWTWSILLNGPRAERLGQIRVMIPMLALAALAAVGLALAPNVLLLYFFTAVIGFSCGAIVPSSFSFLSEQSDPKKRGLFYGAAQSSYTLVGSAIGAVVFTRLSASILGWRGSYWIIAGLLTLSCLVLLLARRYFPRKKMVAKTIKTSHFRALFAYPNAILSTVLDALSMMWYFTVMAFTILYLMDTKGLSAVAAGAIFAGFGGGGFIGEFIAPFISDWCGRKRTAFLSALGGGFCYAAFVFLPLSNSALTFVLAAASFFMSGVLSILNSVVPSESVPPQLIATATSFTPACGQLMGGVVAPVAAGLLGTETAMALLVGLPFLIAFGVLFLKETAPLVLARRAKRRSSIHV